MASLSRLGHCKSRKKAHFTKLKKGDLIPCRMQFNMHFQYQTIKFPKSRLERSAPAPLQTTSRDGKGKRRRHSQHRPSIIESRPRVLTGQTYGSADHAVGAQVSESPPVSREKSKRLRPETKSNLLFSASPTLETFHGEVNSTFNVGAGDLTSASTLSSCSCLALGRSGCHVSCSGSSDSVKKPAFEPLSRRSVRYVQTSSLASSSDLSVAPRLAFPVSQFSVAAAGISITPRPQMSPIVLVLDSSPERNLQLCARSPTQKRLQEIRKCNSPIILSVNNGATNLQHYKIGHSSSVVDTSASSSSTLKLAQKERVLHHKHYQCYLRFGPEINAIPSSPKLMFQQILKDQSCGLSPLIEAETSRCKMFHFTGLEEQFGMLEKLRERELGLPLLWGYLDRRCTTGINEPHRHLIVIWQIQHASKYKYQLDTLFTAVSLLDRCLFLGTSVNRQMLWLLAVACMCIAVKIEETQFSSIIPAMQDICTEAAGQKACFTKRQLIWMETVVLHAVNYECLRPTAATFIWHYLQDYRTDKEMQCLALTVLCLSLTDYEVLHFPASIVAASTVYLSCLVLSKAPPQVVIENVTGHTEDAMKNCVKRLNFLFAEASGTQTDIYR